MDRKPDSTGRFSTVEGRRTPGGATTSPAAEVVDLLAARVPDLAQVLASRQDAPVTVLDRTIVSTGAGEV